MTTYTSQYPPAQNTTYVKATLEYTAQPAFRATNPVESLTGADTWEGCCNGVPQRLHIDLGSGKIIRRIYYENYHYSGEYTNRGAKTITVWGSNTAGDFADLTYVNNGTWVSITPSQGTFDQHATSDNPDPKYITLTNTVSYRYYAIKIADNYGGNWIGIRRIELQTEDGYGVEPGTRTIFAGSYVRYVKI